MPAKPGYRLYGGSPAEVVASVLSVAGVSVLGPTVTGTVQPRSSAGGAVITDLLNESGATITSVPITAGSFLSVFQAPAGTPVYVPGVGGAWLKLTPTDLLDVVASLESPTVESLGGTTALGRTLMSPPSALAAREALGVGAGLPSGGTTGQVVTKQSDGTVAYTSPAAAPTEIASAELASSSSNVLGSISGRRFKAAFDALLGTALAGLGFTIERQWDAGARTWDPLNLPAWYTKPVRWVSASDATATAPPEKRPQDRWLRRKPTA